MALNPAKDEGEMKPNRIKVFDILRDVRKICTDAELLKLRMGQEANISTDAWQAIRELDKATLLLGVAATKWQLYTEKYDRRVVEK